jgi:hypothetical protein
MNQKSIILIIEAIREHKRSFITNFLNPGVRKELIYSCNIVVRLLILLSALGLGIFSVDLSAQPVLADNSTSVSNPILEVMPQEGTVGTQVYIRVINYQVNKQVIITFGTTTVIGTGTTAEIKTIVATKLTTDSSGYGVIDFPIDVYPAGRYIIMADDGVNKLTAGFKVTPSIRLANDVVSGFVGDTVVVSGYGFAMKKLVYLGVDDLKLVTGETDEKGRFYDLKVVIPACARGNHNIKAQDSENYNTTQVFNVRQQMNIVPTSAAVGDNVTIMGAGFQAVTDVVIYWDDKDVGIIQTGADGSFMTSIKVPASGDGTHRIKLDDRVNKAFKDVTVSSAMSINPTGGFIGMQVGVQGMGFRPGFPVSLTYDNIKLEGTTVNSSGSFNQVFKIPVSRFGQHTLSATDGVNNQRVVFTVESNQPPTPSISLPADGERMTKDAHFEWTPVSDPSGVTYTVDIAEDSKFSNVIMSQANIVANYIDITEDSKMLPGKEKPYYWRVKAVDRASNESGWSLVSSFYKGHTFFTIIGNMPEWVKWVLIVLGLCLFGFMFFWIGHTIRKLRNLDDEDYEEEEEYASNEYDYNSGSNNYKN